MFRGIEGISINKFTFISVPDDELGFKEFKSRNLIFNQGLLAAI